MVDSKTLLAFRRIDVLKNLSLESQTCLAAFSTLRPIRKGETLFCQGEPSPYAFGVLAGEITFVATTSDDRPAAKKNCGAGCFLGGLSLIRELPRAGLASVSQDGELLSLWSSRFRDWSSPQKASIVEDIRRALELSPTV